MGARGLLAAGGPACGLAAEGSVDVLLSSVGAGGLGHVVFFGFFVVRAVAGDLRLQAFGRTAGEGLIVDLAQAPGNAPE